MKLKTLLAIAVILQPLIIFCDSNSDDPRTLHPRQAAVFVPDKSADIKMPRKISKVDKFARKHLKSYKHYRRRLDQYDTEERYELALQCACFEYIKNPDNKGLRKHVEHIVALKYPRTWFDRHPHAAFLPECTTSFFSGMFIYAGALCLVSMPIYIASNLIAQRI